MEDIFTLLYNLINEPGILAILGALMWGIASVVLSPCHLSSIPLLIGYLNSETRNSTQNNLWISINFSVGILITISAIGIITAILGRLIGDIGEWGNKIVSVIFFLFGLYLLDIIPLNFNVKLKKVEIQNPFSSLVLGILFGLALGPCTFAFLAPILGIVLTSSGNELIFPLFLLFFFALGHSLVIVLAGYTTKKVQEYLDWTKKSKAQLYLKRISGILLIVGGIYYILKY